MLSAIKCAQCSQPATYEQCGGLVVCEAHLSPVGRAWRMDARTMALHGAGSATTEEQSRMDAEQLRERLMRAVRDTEPGAAERAERKHQREKVKALVHRAREAWAHEVEDCRTSTAPAVIAHVARARVLLGLLDRLAANIGDTAPVEPYPHTTGSPFSLFRVAVTSWLALSAVEQLVPIAQDGGVR